MLKHAADDIVELRHAGFLDGPAVLRVAHVLIFFRQMRDDVHPRRVHPNEERLAVRLRLVDEALGLVENNGIDRFHVVLDAVDRMRRQRALVGDLLLADLAPARIDGGIVDVRRDAMQNVARPDLVLQVLRIVRMEGIFHRIQMVEIAPELVEAMQGRQIFVAIAEMVLAELARGVAHRLEHRCDRRRLRRHADGRPRLPHRGEARAHRQLPGDEIGAARGAARLGVIVGEERAVRCQLVEIGRPTRHHAAVIGADIEPADIVAHDEKNVRLVACGSGRCRLRCLR
jgi:hypothetical protein